MRSLNARTCPVSSSTARPAAAAAAPRRTPNAAPVPSSSSSRRRTIASAATGGGPSLLQKLGRVFSEKATADIERVFKGASKTREKLGIVDELFAYWTLENSEDALEELEEALIASDFGPRAALRVVDGVRDDVRNGKAKTPADLKASLKRAVVAALQPKQATTEGGGSSGSSSSSGSDGSSSSSSSLNLGAADGPSPPAVVMVVGVNGGGKTTTIGKLAARLRAGGAGVALAAGDTYRAAAKEQLAGWAERSGVAMADSGDAQRPDAVLYKAAQWAAATHNGKKKSGEEEEETEKIDVLLCDTSGRLHTNDGLMAELAKCGRSLGKAHPGAPHETLLVLDGTTGLNMLAQAREFNAAVKLSGLVVTKLDGTAKGGAVVGVVSELGIPVKFVGVGEQVDDLQPFDAEAFVEALFPEEEGK